MIKSLPKRQSLAWNPELSDSSLHASSYTGFSLSRTDTALVISFFVSRYSAYSGVQKR